MITAPQFLFDQQFCWSARATLSGQLVNCFDGYLGRRAGVLHGGPERPLRTRHRRAALETAVIQESQQRFVFASVLRQAAPKVSMPRAMARIFGDRWPYGRPSRRPDSSGRPPLRPPARALMGTRPSRLRRQLSVQESISASSQPTARSPRGIGRGNPSRGYTIDCGGSLRSFLALTLREAEYTKGALLVSTECLGVIELSKAPDPPSRKR